MCVKTTEKGSVKLFEIGNVLSEMVSPEKITYGVSPVDPLIFSGPIQEKRLS